MNTENRVVLFDAVGTLIEPVPDVYSVYQRAGAQFGCHLSLATIKARFQQGRASLFHVGTEQEPDGQLHSSDELERELWLRLVQFVFAELFDHKPLFENLWQHFARTESWQLFDDVKDCWSRLQSRGYRIGIASNFDTRLLPIVAFFPVLSFAEWVFCSAEVQFRKPDLAFYETIQKQVEQTLPNPNIVMVGDDFINDAQAPNRFGWHGIHLQRSKRNGDGVLRSLSELPDQIGS